MIMQELCNTSTYQLIRVFVIGAVELNLVMYYRLVHSTKSIQDIIIQHLCFSPDIREEVLKEDRIIVDL